MPDSFEHIPIVMQGLPKWDSPYEATSFHIAKGLSKNRDVFYVEHPFTWKDYVKNRNSPQIERRKSATTAQPFPFYKNITYIYAPFIPPFNFLSDGTIYSASRRFANKRVWKRVKNILREHDIDHFIYINSFDPVYNLTKYFCDPKLSIYICYDWMYSDPYIARHGVREERKIMKQSDLVVCTSKPLKEYALKINANSYFIGNAVNVNHFLESDDDMPEDYKPIKKPIILFLGNIDNRLDYQLILRTAKANPSLAFVFVGPVQKTAAKLKASSQKNIHLLGPVSYNDVPRYIKNADICWIPFRKSPQTKHIYPLKLHEYLACGKPVITTDFTNLVEFTDVVHFVETETAIEESVFKQLLMDSSKNRQQRINVAKNNTWAKRLEKWNSLINHFLGKKVM